MPFLSANKMLVQTMLFGTVLQEKTIYNHPTTQYEQFIERYYGRHKGSGKLKATVISDVNLRSSNNSSLVPRPRPAFRRY